jgi:acetyltransferase-like isoleucine patch superfamily enzyme
MHERSQNIISRDGRKYIEDDWYPHALPENIVIDDHSYPDTSFSFVRFNSEKENCFVLGYGSGNYGHSNFVGGKNGSIMVGKFTVLQGTTLISNLSITIGDHCMFSWGSIVTDSWIDSSIHTDVRRKMMEAIAISPDRHLDYIAPKAIVIEENVWVGFKAIILPGVRLGRGCVIGSNSIVSDDVPPYAIVAGNPARIIRMLDPNDTVEAMKKAIEELTI